MRVAGGVDEEVVGKSSGPALKLLHQPDPGMQHECNHHHAEGAPLWDAAGMPVGLPKPSSNGVEEEALLMEGLVRSENFQREPSSLQELVEQLPDNLVKAFENVSSAARDRGALELVELDAQRSNEPCIFGSVGSGSASEEVLLLPGLHPWLEVLQSDTGIQPVDFAQNSQAPETSRA